MHECEKRKRVYKFFKSSYTIQELCYWISEWPTDKQRNNVQPKLYGSIEPTNVTRSQSSNKLIATDELGLIKPTTAKMK